MNQNLWWPETISWSWLPAGMSLSLTTNRITHLTLYWTLTPPVKLPFYRIQRGVRTFCGYTWTLLNTLPFQQNEPGLQTSKTFTVQPWPICMDAWWYIKGDTVDGPSVSTSIIYTDHFPGVAGPPIPPAPEIITTDPAIIHNGNHYSFWSGVNWYAVLPFPASLRVYKRIDSLWVLQDVAGAPTFPPGQFADMDARLSSDFATFHIAAYLRASVYPPDTIMYYTFDLDTDTWQLAEAISQNTLGSSEQGRCSLSLDSNDIPHVVWIGPYLRTHHIYYSNRIAAAWSPRQSFISARLALWCPFSAAHDSDNRFHASATTFYGYDLWYNSRPAAGPIQVQELIDPSAINLWGPGLSTWNTHPNLAVTDRDASLEYFLGPAPWHNDLAIYPPVSSYPSMITPPTTINRRYIIFADNDYFPQGIYWVAGPWTTFDILDPFRCTQLAASYTLPTVFSYIAVRSPLNTHTRFWAFTPPL